MDEEGLGRGIEDISHFFLSARERRRGREDRPGIDPSGTDPPGTASPAGTPGSAEPGRQEEPERRPIVWPVVRVGEADSQPERTWRMAWRLAPAGTHVIHLRVSAESTEVRWLGQAEHPPAGQTAVELIDPADVAVIDLTEASRALQEQVALAAGRLVVVTGSSDTDCVAAYSFIKEARDPLGEVTIGLEVEGPEEASAAAFTRVRDAVGYFLKRPLVDWRDRYPLPESAAPGPEPTLAARAPTETIQGVLCGLAARSRAREVEEVPSPAASPGPPPSREETTATPAQPSPTEEGPSPGGGAVLPLLTWTCPSPSELADFLESHPHLLQPDLLVLDRGLHPAGEGVVDLLARVSGGRAVVVLVSVEGDAALLAAGLAYARWSVRESALIGRLHGRLRLSEADPPRLILASCRFSGDVVEAARALRRPAVGLVQLLPYELEGRRAVAVSTLV